jgi:hypothetical protein
MVDTLALGASGGNPVKVQVLSRPPNALISGYAPFLLACTTPLFWLCFIIQLCSELSSTSIAEYYHEQAPER